MPRGLGLLARRGRPGRRARPADEPDDGAVRVDGQGIGELGHDRGAERLGAQLEDPPAATAAARHGRDHRHLVTVGQRRRRLGVVAVPGEAQRRTTGREDRETAGERDPRRLDVGAVGELERDLARAGQLALDGEQADPDRDRHGRPVSPATRR